MITEKNLKLIVELMPSTVWYSSVYQYYKKSNNLQKWNEIKKELYEKEGDACWICKSYVKPLEAHESWSYDDREHIQKLEAIHHLCGFCHKIKHIGLWLHTEDGEKMLRKTDLTKQDVVNHFCKVNNCSEGDFKEHEEKAFVVWSERSKHQWKQDFGIYASKEKATQVKNVTLKQFT